MERMTPNLEELFEAIVNVKDDDAITEQERTQMRGVLGTCGWISTQQAPLFSAEVCILRRVQTIYKLYLQGKIHPWKL